MSPLYKFDHVARYVFDSQHFTHVQYTLTDTIRQTNGPLAPMVRLVPIENDVIPMVVLVNMHSDFPQACWPHCRLISPANRYSCLIQHMLYCIQLVVLGR